MTEQEREERARLLYQALYVDAGYTAKPWSALHGFERHRFYVAVDRLFAREAVVAAGRIVAGQAA
jgi:hypothetical protein